MAEKAPLRIVVTGAAGQIAYSLLYQVSLGQPCFECDPSFKGGFRICLWRGPATYPPPARHPGGHGCSRRSCYGAPGLRLAPYQVSHSVKATWNRLRKMWKRKSQKFHTTAQKIYESNMYLTVTFKGLKHYISRDVVATDDPNVAFKVLKNLKYRK